MARILIAEDDAHIGRVIALWLKRGGHEVMVVDSGDKALAMIRERAPDLLVTDINMPVMDGLQLLETVRAESLLTHQAIVLTSRCDQADIEARVAGLGAVVHPKPFSPINLTETIEAALSAPVGACSAQPTATATESERCRSD